MLQLNQINWFLDWLPEINQKEVNWFNGINWDCFICGDCGKYCNSTVKPLLANNIKLMFHYPKGIVSNYCYNNILKILYVFRNKIICCWIQFLPFPQALIPPVWMFWRNEKLGGNNKKWLQFTVIIKFSSSNPSAFINQSNFNKLTECLQSNLVSVCFD